MYVLGTLGPIILLVALGLALRRGGFANLAFFRQTNRLVYWIALPALLFAKTAGMTPDLDAVLHAFVIMLAGTAIAFVVAELAGHALKLPPPSRAAFVQAGYRGNLAYVGLPVVLYALAGADTNASTADEVTAVLAMAPLIPVYNVTAVWVLVRGASREAGERLSLGTLLGQIARNPILIGIVAGLAVAFAPVSLPRLLQRTIGLIGQLALPLALLGIGASLSFSALRGHGKAAVAGTVVKTFVCPLGGLLVAALMGVAGRQLLVALLFLACPTATASYVMAERLDADAALTASIIVLSTVVSMPVLAAILAIL